MLFGKLNSPGTYDAWLRHPVWQEALAWLRQLPASPAPGVHELRGRDMYADIHGYETQPREKRRYEAHRRYLDLQYCLAGGEGIDWTPLGELAPSDDYHATKDVIHFHRPEVPGGTLWMTPGAFAIFFPEDGHMPKIHDGRNPRVEKLVIKIDATLLRER